MRPTRNASARALLVVGIVRGAGDAIGLRHIAGGLIGLRCRGQGLAKCTAARAGEAALEEGPGMCVAGRTLDPEAHRYRWRPRLVLVSIAVHHEREHGDGIFKLATLLAAKTMSHRAAF